jgi:hypothetical protein
VSRVAVTLAFLQFALALVASAQVQVTVPAHEFIANETIPATVQNDGREPVTFCVEFGQTSTHVATTEVTPIPFVIQAISKGAWHALLVGPDVGSSRHAVVLEAGKSIEFPFRLNATGNVRLLLIYWQGSLPELECSKPPKGSHVVKSNAFFMRLLVEH